ncbi:MAG: ABC transporter substrate-binding protein [Dehalococcoidales bacterium]|nr:ABC transporter substrate-binding protein [Dehalococcoidales bacterium]
MHKKIVSISLAVVLCLVFIVSLTACSESTPTTSSAPAPAPAKSAPPVSQPASAPPASTAAKPAQAPSTSKAPPPPPASSAPAIATTLRIGLTGGLTGVAAPAVNAIMKEFQYVFKYVNENEGGIDGIKLDWKIVDNKGTPDGAVMAYKELRDSYKPHIYIAVEDYYMLGLRDAFIEDKAAVIVTSALDSRMYVPPGRVFGVSMATADGFAALSEWIVNDWQGEGKPKIGMLHIDLPSGLSWKLAENYVRNKGVDIIATAPYSMAALDVKPQLMTLRDAGSDYMWIQANNQQAAVIIRDFRGLGLSGKIKPVFMEWTESDKLLELVGEEAEGFYQTRSESPAADGSEASKLWSEIWKINTGDDRWCDNRLTLNVKAVLTAAVKQAAADVGADKLDGEALYNALTRLSDIDTAGNVGALGYSDTRRMGVSTMKISCYTKTGTESVSDWITLPRIFEGIDK